MGFLDILSNKKSGESVPPPAPGPSAEGVKHPESNNSNNNDNSQKQGDAPVAPGPSAPTPPMPQPLPNQASNSNIPQPPSATNPQQAMNNSDSIPNPSQNSSSANPAVQERQTQNNNSSMKLDLPTFPNSDIGNNQGMDIPDFNPNPASVPSKPDLKDNRNTKSSNEFPSVPKVDSDNSTQEKKPNMSSSNSQDSQSSYWSSKSYLSNDEEKLNDMKRELHRPNAEYGTDFERVGNVEKHIKKKVKYDKGPIFTEINNYKRVLNSVDEIKRDLTESQDMISKLEEYNDKKHNEFEEWKKIFKYIQGKLNFVDKTLFEEGGR